MRFRGAVKRWVCRRRGHQWVGTTVSWWQAGPGDAGPTYHVESGPKICARCQTQIGVFIIPTPPTRIESVALTPDA